MTPDSDILMEKFFFFFVLISFFDFQEVFLNFWLLTYLSIRAISIRNGREQTYIL